MKKLRLICFVVGLLTLIVMPVAAQGGPVQIVLPLLGFATELQGWTQTVDAANKVLAGKNIQIVVQNVPVTDWNEYYQRAVSQIAAGQPLDIGRLAESHLPIAVDDGVVMDLTDHINALNMDEYFSNAFKSAAYQDGHYYGIPSGIYYLVMYYNKDLFDAAKLPYPSADWNNSITFDQVRADAKKLTTGEGPNKTFGFSAGPYMAYIGMYASSGGGHNVYTPDGTCALTEPASLQVYKWFDGMLREDMSQPRPTDTTVMAPFDMFTAGRIGMIVDGTWFQTAMRDIKNFKVGIAAVPSASGKAVSAGFVDSWVIWDGTAHPDEAWEALQALTSVEASETLAQQGVGGVPVRRETLDKLSDTMIGANFDEASHKAFIEGLDHIQAVPYNKNYNETDTEINAVMDDWLLGNVTADQFAARSCDIMASVSGQ